MERRKTLACETNPSILQITDSVQQREMILRCLIQITNLITSNKCVLRIANRGFGYAQHYTNHLLHLCVKIVI